MHVHVITLSAMFSAADHACLISQGIIVKIGGQIFLFFSIHNELKLESPFPKPDKYPLLMKIEFLTSLYRIALELVTE